VKSHFWFPIENFFSFGSVARQEIYFRRALIPRVVSAGSDVLTLFANILLQPSDWLMKGRVWNEQYFLRTFLQYNSSFRIKLFTPHMIARYGAWFREHMPDCFRNTGGHIWIERVG
jgi:hypothetical protein